MNSTKPNNNGRRLRAAAPARPKGSALRQPRVRRRNRNPRPVQGGGALSAQVNPILPAAAPQQTSGQRHETRVCARRELVQQVVGTSAFTAVNYPINAGLGQMFAWLSSDARRFEKYRFRRLAFEYVNSVGPADTTNSPGNVVFAVDFDVLDSAPVTLQGMMQNETAKLFSPYDKVRMELDPADLNRRGWLFTRVGGVPSGADAKTYDLGSLVLAQSGCSTNGLGNLFVDYVVELDVPQEVPVDGQRINGTAGLTAASLIGSDAAAAGNPNWTITSSSTLTCAVAGEYLFWVALVGTVLSATIGGSAPGGTATSTECIAIVDGAQTAADYMFVVRAQVGQTLVPGINGATTITSAIWRISSYKYSLG